MSAAFIRRHLYRVNVYEASFCIATWERFAESQAQAVDQGLIAARKEFPAATSLEVFASYVESVRSRVA